MEQDKGHNCHNCLNRTWPYALLLTLHIMNKGQKYFLYEDLYHLWMEKCLARLKNAEIALAMRAHRIATIFHWKKYEDCDVFAEEADRNLPGDTIPPFRPPC